MSTRTEGRPAPLTERGRRTRDKLLVAAREVFERRGYAGARMADIATAAGVSHGTTYTWFDDKEAVLRALVADIVTEVYAALAIGDDVPEPQERMLEANRRYLAAYRRHGRMLEVVEEAATTDEHYRDALAGVRRDHVRRVTRDIERLQGLRIADTDIDAAVAAGALCAMVEGFGRHWYGRGEQVGAAYDDDTAVETLSLLWARGLGLNTPTTGTTTEEQG